ncbi:MAG: VWA domain-containing protein, partial [Candidatus Aminicenantes bacterium]|nr:VWA domain-containing protein [Candidatus Aminicenantes bacterium]
MTTSMQVRAKSLFILLLFGLGSRLYADGIIIPRPRPGETIPPLTVKYHRVTVEIRDQAARTSIDQVFLNNHDRDIEGTFIFPLPKNAVISEFALYIGDKKVEAEILDSQEARRVYEDIVRRLKDPGLLEYIGRSAFRARVYPIPARGEKRVQLSYEEVLQEERGLIRYLYPLNTERFSLHPIEEVAVSVNIRSRAPITNVYSPSHRVSVRKESPNSARIGYEERNVRPDKDFLVYYAVSAEEVGLSFLSYRDGDERTFMLLAAPRFSKVGEKVINKNLIFVLDSSGSMQGKKIRHAREAARFIINHLDEGDHFSIIDFDDGVTLFSDGIVPASAANRERAVQFVEAVEDSGGTNIHEALLRAFRMMPQGDRPNYVLFLTDGLPTVGITSTAEILRDVTNSNTAASRLFVFGVGNDVNTELLDKLAAENRGTSVYVSEQEDLEVTVSGFYEKISSPVLSDLNLALSGIEVYHSYPRTLPDLFRGGQLILLGKCRGNGPVSIVLKGKVGRQEKVFRLENQKFLQDEELHFLPRLWAARRIGYLLDEIRLKGEAKELVEEVRNLGLKYGIVTPYTSFLVTEKERLSIAAAAPDAQEALAGRQVTGAGAVKLARSTQAFKEVDQAPQVVSRKIRYKEDKTFYFKDGFW